MSLKVDDINTTVHTEFTCCWCQWMKIMGEALDKTALKWGTKSFAPLYQLLIAGVTFLPQNTENFKNLCCSLASPDLGCCIFLTVELVGSVGWVLVANLGIFGEQGSCHCLLPTGCHSDPWSLWRRGSSPRWQTLGWWSDSGGKLHSLCFWLWRLVFSSAEVPCRLNRILSQGFPSVTKNVLKNSYFLIYSYKLKVQIENALNLIEQGSSWIT